MGDESARTRYEQKREWQKLHEAICSTIESICGNHEAIFRLRSTGAWQLSGGQFSGAAVSYDEDINQKKLASYTALGKEYLPQLDSNRACTILTIVPMVKTDMGTARAIAAALGLRLVAPEVPGLVTFDHFHLDRKSAQRWSAAFFEEAGPQIQKCLGEQPESHLAMSGTHSRNSD